MAFMNMLKRGLRGRHVPWHSHHHRQKNNLMPHTNDAHDIEEHIIILPSIGTFSITSAAHYHYFSEYFEEWTQLGALQRVCSGIRHINKTSIHIHQLHHHHWLATMNELLYNNYIPTTWLVQELLKRTDLPNGDICLFHYPLTQVPYITTQELQDAFDTLASITSTTNNSSSCCRKYGNI